MRVACYLCGKKVTNEEKLYDINNFSVYECSQCKLVFTDTSRTLINTKKVNEDFYEKEYRKSYLKKQEYMVRRFLDRIDDIKLYMPLGGKVLDIGCSYGYFLEALKQDNEKEKIWDSYGVEVSKGGASYSNKKYGNVFNGYLEEVGFPSETFDLVTMWDVLEHVPDPKGILREVKRILKKDGLLVIQSPNSNSLLVKIFGKNWEWWLPPDHLWHFNPMSLSRLYKDSNLDLFAYKTWESPTDFVNMIYGPYFSSIRPRKISEPVIKAVIYAIVLILQFMEGKDKGGLLIAYARKK